ncbi:hypothetical protein AWZ03_003322 [Drosophila navojoa]|uniref:Uncharacterized protein n=1 Tax=Drosophila navojoa TaxID=7232 RepID=A0A484BNS1_DRONA|nr:hypothetical protein AWZ03_003322 [Drosophila navojoa]
MQHLREICDRAKVAGAMQNYANAAATAPRFSSGSGPGPGPASAPIPDPDPEPVSVPRTTDVPHQSHASLPQPLLVGAAATTPWAT